MKIALSTLNISPQQIRKTWTDEGIEELAQSIKEQGLIVPIKVRPNETGYKIIYGHRRVEALRLLGIEETDAIVEGMDDFAALLQQATENESREDVPYEEKALGYKTLLEHPDAPEDLSHNKLAKIIGINRRTVDTAIVWLSERNKGVVVGFEPNQHSVGAPAYGVGQTVEIK